VGLSQPGNQPGERGDPAANVRDGPLTIDWIAPIPEDDDGDKARLAAYLGLELDSDYAFSAEP
jgi:hypothetical protein